MTKAAKDLFVPEKLPQWFKDLPAHALLSGRDMLRMFGFKATDSFVRSKCFPKPDKVVKGFKNEKALWRKKTVLKEIKRRKRVNAGEEQHATIRDDLRTKVVEDISGVTHIGRLPCVCKELPEWFTTLPDNAILSKAQVIQIFPYGSMNTFSSAVSRGVFPKKDTSEGWLKTTIINEFSKRTDRAQDRRYHD